MENFRIVLLILSGLAIPILVAHGIWTMRKNVQDSETDDTAVNHEKTPSAKKKESKSAKSLIKQIVPDKQEEQVKARVEPNIDGNLVLPEESNDGQIEIPLPKEPKVTTAETKADDIKNIRPKAATDTGQPEEVLILNIVAPEGQQISGAALLPFLLTLGFKFGDMAIFHRYENNAGGGDVLFSLANMFNPGTFDIDNMETFSTQGVSLFMSLPVKDDPNQVFNMMHNAAKKLAAEFSGQVLDGQRSVLTSQTLQHYKERIREFERRQLLK